MTSMTSNAISSLLWFVAIVAMIPVALWLLKRTPAGAMLGGTGGHGVMRNVAALPLSASQRIVMVEVGQADARRWLVLGVTAQSITILYSLAPQDDAPAAPAAPAPAFAQLLAKLRRNATTDGR